MYSPNGPSDYRVLVPADKQACRTCFGSGRSMTVRIGSAGQPIADYGPCPDADCTATPRRTTPDLTFLLALSLKKCQTPRGE